MVKKFSHEERIEYLKKFGSHCMAYSTLQQGMQYFDLPNIGYLAYMKQGRTRFILGDPICAEENREKLISAALNEFPCTSFYQVSKSTAEILHKKFGFHMNIFGTETNLYRNEIWKKDKNSVQNQELQDLIEEERIATERKDKIYSIMSSDVSLKKEFWSTKKIVQSLRAKIARLKEEKEKQENPLINYLKNPALNPIKRQYNLALEAGVKIYEERIDESNKAILESISNEWVSTRMVSSREMKFFTRPLNPQLDSENFVRLFTAKNKYQEVLGFLLLDPLFKNNKIIGYFADILRIRKNAPIGTATLLLIAALDSVFNEGYEIYTLGLSPFHQIGKVYFKNKNSPEKIRADNRIMTSIFKNTFNYGNFLYNAKAQAFHKERFKGTMEHTYCCSRKKFPLKEILDGFFVSGINPLKQIKAILRKL